MAMTLFGEELLQAQSRTGPGVIPTAAPIKCWKCLLKIRSDLTSNEADNRIREASTQTRKTGVLTTKLPTLQEPSATTCGAEPDALRYIASCP